MEKITEFSFWKGSFSKEALTILRALLRYTDCNGCVPAVEETDTFFRCRIHEEQYKWIMWNLMEHPERFTSGEQSSEEQVDFKPMQQEEPKKRKTKKKQEVEVVEVIEELPKEKQEEVVPENETTPEAAEESSERAAAEGEVLESKDDLIGKILSLMKENKKMELSFDTPAAMLDKNNNGIVAGVVRITDNGEKLFLYMEALEGSPAAFLGKKTSCSATNPLISIEVLRDLLATVTKVLELPF